MQSDDNLYDYRVTLDADGRAVLKHQNNGDCTHLVDGRCEVWHNAPAVCRAFTCAHEAGHDTEIGRAGARIQLGLPGA